LIIASDIKNDSPFRDEPISSKDLNVSIPNVSSSNTAAQKQGKF